MVIVKIQTVKNLKAAVNYTVQDYKTYEKLISTFNCNLDVIEEEFKSVLNAYNKMNHQNKNLTARMIIQSFGKDDDVTPEQAHIMGYEFAKNYLNGQHQFLVVTHIETDNIHNHIIFNNINFEQLKVFDSKRVNTLHRLRSENDKVAEKYNLTPVEKGKTYNKYLSFNEFVVRAKKQSFKSKLEDIIDKNIVASENFESFIELMKKDGYEVKQGKYLAFKNVKTNRFVRTKTLGFNYLEASIRYRIEHKEYTPVKQQFITREWIDKTQEKFKNNKGLHRWATVQNIQYLNELNANLYNNKMTLQEFAVAHENAQNLVDVFNKRLSNLDEEIYSLESMKDTFEQYKSSYNTMYTYKSLESDFERLNFKKQNYVVFKQYDKVKSNMKYLKTVYNISDEESLHAKISSLKNTRRLYYASINMEHTTIEQKQQVELIKRNVELDL